MKPTRAKAGRQLGVLPRSEHAHLVHAVRELRVPTSVERLDAVRHFYSDILGLPPWPSERQFVGGWGVGDVRRGVFFEFRHDPRVNPFMARLTLSVGDLSATAERLEQHGWPFDRRRGLWSMDDALLLTDPAGHRLEIRQMRML